MTHSSVAGRLSNFMHDSSIYTTSLRDQVDADVLVHLLATGQLQYSEVPWSTSFDQSNPCGNDAIGQGML